MIEHLQGRERALEVLGCTGRQAEWIALVCLHSGIFTRAQFCFHLKTSRMTALRFVRRLVDQGFAAEDPMPPRFDRQRAGRPPIHLPDLPSAGLRGAGSGEHPSSQDHLD